MEIAKANRGDCRVNRECDHITRFHHERVPVCGYRKSAQTIITCVSGLECDRKVSNAHTVLGSQVE